MKYVGSMLGVVLMTNTSLLAANWTWDFNNDLLSRGGAAELTAVGEFNYETSTIDGATATVAHYSRPTNSPETHFVVPNPIGANGGGSGFTNSYTLIMDVRFVQSSSFIALYQTNTNNANDGEWFIRDDGGSGISGDYVDGDKDARFEFGVWNRIALVVDNAGTTYRTYVNGQLQNVVAPAMSLDGRWSLESIFLLFADNNGETADHGWINSLQLRDVALSDSEVASLGPASASGIPDTITPSAGIRVGPYMQLAAPTSVWIGWESYVGSESRVDYGLTEALGMTAFGSSIASQGAARIHHTVLTDLTPGTRYYYQVSTGDAQSTMLHFQTPEAPASEEPFRFVAISDTQADGSNPDKLVEVVNDGILDYFSDTYGADIANELEFVMLAGDLVDAGSVYNQWKDDFFDEAQNLLQHVPLYPVLGNHEQNAHWYFDYFHLPQNGTPGYEEHWYYHDHGNVRLIGLDSNGGYRIQEQLDWLDTVLAETCNDDQIDFVFAQLHHPYKSEPWIAGNTDYTGQIVRRLEQFSTDCGKPSAHLFGHTHAYSRGQSRDHTHLWVNVATGEGNIDYWGEFAQADYDEFEKSLVEYGFVVLDVTAGNNPEFTLTRVSRGNEFLARDNDVVDALTIALNNNGPATPTAASPDDAACRINPLKVVLQGSPFSDRDGDGHRESHFQVTTTAGDYTSPVVDKWIRTENWYKPADATGPANGYYSENTVIDPNVTYLAIQSLSGNTAYHWRVRYRDDRLGWSEWSEEASFVTSDLQTGGNLLTNAGAEEGTDDWAIVEGVFESLTAGECNTGTDPVSGSRFFAIGGVCANEGAYGEVTQTIDLSSHASTIDAGSLVVTAGGYLKDYNGSDRPDIWLVFEDAQGAALLSTEKLSGQTPSWTQTELTASAPSGARQVVFHLSGTRLAGTDNDCYADDLYLYLGANQQSADLNGDGKVDFADFVIWVLCEAGPNIAPACAEPESITADLDADGDVDVADFKLLLTYVCQ